jgi:preprotein translocase subunit SecE
MGLGRLGTIAVMLQVYKAGQGRYVRVCTAIGVAVVLIILAWFTWLMLDRHVSNDFSFKMYLEYGIPALQFVAMALVAAYYLNKPVFVDFLIATESEMKKVSWSSRPELIGSTSVVIITVLLLALFIYIADYVFIGGMSAGWPIPFTSLRIPGLGLW